MQYSIDIRNETFAATLQHILIYATHQREDHSDFFTLVSNLIHPDTEQFIITPSDTRYTLIDKLAQYAQSPDAKLLASKFYYHLCAISAYTQRVEMNANVA